MTPIKNIVLDIDQTLLEANDKIHNPLNSYRRETNVSSAASTLSTPSISDEYVFTLRPYLAPFLNFLFENFNVGIWTAADTTYAQYVVDSIIFPLTHRKPQFVLSRPDFDDCLAKGMGYKNLAYLAQRYPQFNYNNTIIIDDFDHVKMTNRARCIAIPKFFAALKSNDTALLSLINALKSVVLSGVLSGRK